MGHNDHLPVPDPTPKLGTHGTPPGCYPVRMKEFVAEKGIPSTAALQEITSRLAALEDQMKGVMAIVYRNDRTTSLERHAIELGELRKYTDACLLGWDKHNNRIIQLEAKLKETIRGVEKLAQGKSLGALGLPTEESWI